ncbi:hypothetical protein [Streptosporangium sp. NPDC000396]
MSAGPIPYRGAPPKRDPRRRRVLRALTVGVFLHLKRLAVGRRGGF